MPQAIPHGGPVLSNVEAVVIFYGSTSGSPGIGDWQTDPMLREQACRLQDFFRDITDSAYLAGLAEYTPAGSTPIGHGSLEATAFIPFAPGKTYGMFLDQALSDAEIRSMIQNAIAQNTVPPPNANRAYFVFVPPYVAVTHKDELSPSGFQGYHDSIIGNIGAIPYAVMTHPGANPILPDGAPDTFQQLTFEASHEMVELITDPIAIPNQGWYSSAGEEIADICENGKNFPNQTYREWGTFHGYAVAAYWSNHQAMCVVPPEDGLAKPARTVSIHRRLTSSCDLGVVETSTATFTVDTSKLAGGPYKYQWTVMGAGSGALTNPTVDVTVPQAGSSFTLSVVVTDGGGCQISATAVIMPVSGRQAELWSLLCKMRHYLLVNFRFNPLWDPLRDLTTTPISERDVRRLVQVSKEFVRMAEGLEQLQARGDI